MHLISIRRRILVVFDVAFYHFLSWFALDSVYSVHNIYLLGMVMGRGKPLFRICVGGRRPDGRGILPPVPFVNLFGGSGGAYVWVTGATANVEFGFESVANVEFSAESYSGLFRLPLELPDERLWGVGSEIRMLVANWWRGRLNYSHYSMKIFQTRNRNLNVSRCNCNTRMRVESNRPFYCQ